jgi:hypothetical protein
MAEQRQMNFVFILYLILKSVLHPDSDNWLFGLAMVVETRRLRLCEAEELQRTARPKATPKCH